jgi:hypothetical protein
MLCYTNVHSSPVDHANLGSGDAMATEEKVEDCGNRVSDASESSGLGRRSKCWIARD